MSGPDECLLPRECGRVLMLVTSVLAVAATAVLALGAQDARLLRLGLVAALWAALLGAFAVARMRHELSSGADQADELRVVYRHELEREIAARREHTLTVERELREQAEQAQRCEILGMRAELAALRANLECLLSRDALVERVALPAEPARVVSLPALPRSYDESNGRVAAVGSVVKATRSFTVAGSSVRAQGSSGLASQDVPGGRGEQFCLDRTPASGGSVLSVSEWSVNGCSDAFPVSGEDSEKPHFGPGRSHPLTANNGRHGAPNQEPSGAHGNGYYHGESHINGSHINVGGTRWAPEPAPALETQRSVSDLLAAYGDDSVPRRRRGRDVS